MTKKPCENCGENRWKTIKKGVIWECRFCGLERRQYRNKEI